MGQHLAHIDSLKFVLNSRDQSILIAGDVENGQPPYQFCAGKGCAKIWKGAPSRLACQLVPRRERMFGLMMDQPEIPQCLLADYAQ